MLASNAQKVQDRDSLHKLVSTVLCADRFLYSWVSIGCPNIEPKFFRTRSVKRPYIRLRSTLSTNPDNLNSTHFSDITPNHGGYF